MRRQPASLHNDALKKRRTQKQVHQGVDPDFYSMDESHPLPPNCPTDKGGTNAKKPTATRARSKSGGGSNTSGTARSRSGRGTSTGRRRQSPSKKRRSPATAGGEDSKPKSRTSAIRSGRPGGGGGGRKSRKNSGMSSPRDSCGETASGAGVASGQAPADEHHESLAGFPWQQEMDALTFLDDPDVQAHGRLNLQEVNEAPISSGAWGMPPKPTIPTTGMAASSTIIPPRPELS